MTWRCKKIVRLSGVKAEGEAALLPPQPLSSSARLLRSPSYGTLLSIELIGGSGAQMVGVSARCRDRVRLPRMIWITGMRQVSSFAKFAILYTALYSAFGVVSPFLPPFLGARGLTAEQIAAVIGSATAVRLVSGPLVGRLADRQRLWRGLLAGCIGAAGERYSATGRHAMRRNGRARAALSRGVLSAWCS